MRDICIAVALLVSHGTEHDSGKLVAVGREYWGSTDCDG